MAEGAKNGQQDDMDRAANGRAEDMSDPALLQLLQHVINDFSAHKRECGEERRYAQEQRDKLVGKVDAGFAKVDGSISKLHDRLNEVVTTGHAGEAKTWDWRMKTVSGVMVAFAGVAAFLASKLLGWT